MDQQTPRRRRSSERRFRPYATTRAEELKAAVLAKLTYSVGKDPVAASQRDWFLAVAFATRDIIVDRWMHSTTRVYADDRKRVYYLSLEFLIGRLLFDALTNLGIVEPMRAALVAARRRSRRAAPDRARRGARQWRPRPARRLLHGQHGDAVDRRARLRHSLRPRPVPAGHPGRLAAGSIPRTGCRSAIRGSSSGPRSITRSASAAGSRRSPAATERRATSGIPAETVEAVAYDTPIVGWRGRHVNTLRLWSARALDPLRLDAFNAGDYIGALADRVRAEAISKVLYPSDATPAGQELRLRQEYFFASASLQDLVRRHVKQHRRHPHARRQGGDPAQRHASRDRRRRADAHSGRPARRSTGTRPGRSRKATFSYTNHTLLPEALESWPVPLMERLLPRHMQIIYLINALHLDGARKRRPRRSRRCSPPSR